MLNWYLIKSSSIFERFNFPMETTHLQNSNIPDNKRKQVDK
jgi:hypothetical protein